MSGPSSTAPRKLLIANAAMGQTGPLSAIPIERIRQVFEVNVNGTIESWTYRDAPEYGSDELDARPEVMASLALSADRKAISIVLAAREQTRVHPQQTGRVYYAKLAAKTLFDANAPEQLEAYYTLHRFP